VDELDRNADALGTATLMHQAGAVGGDDVFGSRLRVIADLVVAHLAGDNFLEDAEGAAEAAAFVRTGWLDELDTRDLGQQVDGLGEERLIELGRKRVLEPAQCTATVVEADPMRESGLARISHTE
jgi:hypothetical protein